VIQDKRLGALRRFAVAITVLNLAGHLFLGFEQSWAQPVAAILTAYLMELLLETVQSRAQGRRPRFLGGARALVDFLLSAHISGLAVSMLLYANDRLWVVAFAAAVAIGSKAIFRVRVGRGTRHVFNPSNLGITATLLLFPWVGIAPPYQFTEGLYHGWDWVLPAIIVCTGTFLNVRFTGKLALILSWMGAFALQAAIRSALFHTPLAAGLLPMTGVAFVLFSYYMISDPATTPAGRRGQILFGAAVAAAYGSLMLFHIVYGLFFALSLVCAGRGCLLALQEVARARAGSLVPIPDVRIAPSPAPAAANSMPAAAGATSTVGALQGVERG
jgi:hypothetical protein